MYIIDIIITDNNVAVYAPRMSTENVSRYFIQVIYNYSSCTLRKSHVELAEVYFHPTTTLHWHMEHQYLLTCYTHIWYTVLFWERYIIQTCA